MEIKPGQIWRVKDVDRIYDLGYQDDVLMVLHLDGEYWGVGVFWWSGKPFGGHDDFGGMRSNRKLSEEEIESACEYVGHIADYIPAPVQTNKEIVERVESAKKNKDSLPLVGENK